MDNTTKRIVVDAMGGDFAPKNEINGGLLALQAMPDVHVIFTGNKNEIQAELNTNKEAQRPEFISRYEIVDASDAVTMHDNPIIALKTKKNSSMVLGIQLVKDCKADGYISAGNTGATMALATTILGCIEGASRPTIGAFIPTTKGKPVFLLDVGATIECRSRYMYEYAIMGSVLYNSICNVENPSVGLLNVGSEETKGTKELLEAHSKLKNCNKINFFGNVEGGDILTGKTDVVVADGYVGNAILKFTESIADAVGYAVEKFNKANENDPEKLEITNLIVRELVDGFDAERYGGTPLLGVKGNIIIGHGNSSAIAIRNMILSACTCVEKNICNKIALKLSNI